jgi:hypothetical protein
MKPEATKPAEQTAKARKPEAKIEGSQELNDADLDKATGGALGSYVNVQMTKQGKMK